MVIFAGNVRFNMFSTFCGGVGTMNVVNNLFLGPDPSHQHNIYGNSSIGYLDS